MPPKNSNKEVDESLLQIFADKLQENKDQQDVRHEAIAESLCVITDKLEGMNFPPSSPPQHPDPPNMASSSNLTNPNQIHNPPFPILIIPQLSPSNTATQIPTSYPQFSLTHVPPFFNPPYAYTHPTMGLIPNPPTQPRPPKLQLIPFDGSEPLD
ncbi:unnamed protein product [Lupinus luteus]|uniref:Uncharacterized protein n=1 Tax=Lupinus luteus TaxID=3873 RepID=A0AAV1X9X0_LUPLU